MNPAFLILLFRMDVALAKSEVVRADESCEIFLISSCISCMILSTFALELTLKCVSGRRSEIPI